MFHMWKILLDDVFNNGCLFYLYCQITIENPILHLFRGFTCEIFGHRVIISKLALIVINNETMAEINDRLFSDHCYF